jgi:hypothetical protein
MIEIDGWLWVFEANASRMSHFVHGIQQPMIEPGVRHINCFSRGHEIITSVARATLVWLRHNRTGHFDEQTTS